MKKILMLMAIVLPILLCSCSHDEPLPDGVLFEEPYFGFGVSEQQINSYAPGSLSYHYKGGEKDWIAFKDNQNIEYHYIMQDERLNEINVYVPQTIADKNKVYHFLNETYVYRDKKDNNYGHVTYMFEINKRNGIFVEFIIQDEKTSYIRYYCEGLIFAEPYLHFGASEQQINSHAPGTLMEREEEENWIAFKDNQTIEYRYVMQDDRLKEVKVIVPQAIADINKVYQYLDEAYVYRDKEYDDDGYEIYKFEIDKKNGIYVEFIIQDEKTSYIRYYCIK